MTGQPLVDQAQALWLSLVGPGAGFCREHQVDVLPTEDSPLCPPGWVGIVRMADRLLVTAPAEQALRVQDRLNSLDLDDCTDPESLPGKGFDVIETLGPASLAYVEPIEFKAVHTADVVRRPASDPAIGRLLAAVPSAEAGESGIADLDSTAFLVRGGGGFVSAAGYRHWPAGAAHVCLLTATKQRGEGLAHATASAAVAAALAEGLLPQWRARSDESRRIAAALGFRELGSQFSFRLA